MLNLNKKKLPSFKAASRGFSLLEVLVAFCVLGVLSLSWLKLNLLALKVVQNNKITRVASEMISEYYDQLKRDRYSFRAGCNPLGQDRVQEQGTFVFSLNSILIDRSITEVGVAHYLERFAGCALKQGRNDIEWERKNRVDQEVKEFAPFLEIQDLHNFKILLVKVSFKDYSSGKQGELKRIASFYD